MAISQFLSVKGDLPPMIGNQMQEALASMQGLGLDLQDKVLDLLRSLTPSRTGFLRSQAKTWGYRVYGRGGFTFRFGWRRRDFTGQRSFYAEAVNWGTGIYGQYRSPIVPRFAARLAWQDEGGSWHSATEVLGQEGQHMLEETRDYALREVAKMWGNSTFETLRKYYK